MKFINGASTDHLTVTILLTVEVPIRCKATTASPSLQSPLLFACCRPKSSASSIDSVLKPLVDPAHKTGTKPQKIKLCLAGASSLADHSTESLLTSGTAADKIGTRGRYLATSLSVLPPRVSTKIRLARDVLVVRTVDDAKLSSGLIGTGAFAANSRYPEVRCIRYTGPGPSVRNKYPGRDPMLGIIAATLGCDVSVYTGPRPYTSSCPPTLGDVATVRTGSTLPRLTTVHTEIHVTNCNYLVTRTNQYTQRMVRDSVQLETAVNTISHEYLLEFTSEYGIPKMLHPELPGPGDRIVDFPEGKGTIRYTYPNCCGLADKYFQRRDAGEWYLLRRSCEGAGYASYPHPKTTEDVTVLGRNKSQILSGDEVYPTFHYDDDRDGLIHTPNPTKVKTGSRPRAPYEVPLLTLTSSRVIEMDEPAVATDSSGVPSTIEKSLLDFANEGEASDQGTAAPEIPPPEDVPATAAPGVGQAEEAVAAEPSVAREIRKRGHDRVDANAPPKSLQRDHADLRPSGSSHGRKSLAAMQLCLASNVFVSEGAPANVSDPDPLSFADAPSHPPVDVAQSPPSVVAAKDPESENASSPTEVRSPGSVYRLEWGVTNGNLLDTPEACQDLVDHVAPSGYFFELCHMRNEDFLRQYNVNLARQVALGSQLRLRFEQETKLLRKSVAQVARRDKRIEARELEIKNIEARLETEADMKRAAEDMSAGLIKELEDMRARFSDLQVSHGQLSHQVASLKEQVSGEEKLKAAFEKFKQYENERIERWCAELDAHLDALSINFDEELYPHMLTTITCRRWVIGHGLRLAMMKCAESLEMRQAFTDVVSAGVAKGMSEGLKHEVEHGRAQLTVESIEAYDLEAEAKFVAAFQSLKDLKYPLLDQLEGLKDAPMDVIMAALYLESDTGGDAPQYIRDLRPSSSQLAIPVYPKARDPRNPWAYKKEIKLSDAIAVNIIRAEKKKKCRIVCRTHGVGSAHHARSDGVPMSVPTVVPQGLALLLVDAATQTDLEDA
uniref:Transposase (Putative), gypsy type n=1 Tax=Tanacetum cinerariifolium TaxID=118510 RepID=A0A6L2J675_TANCI|nr:hypothetical protein [Tanacetum cinerariifolium]